MGTQTQLLQLMPISTMTTPLHVIVLLSWPPHATDDDDDVPTVIGEPRGGVHVTVPLQLHMLFGRQFELSWTEGPFHETEPPQGPGSKFEMAVATHFSVYGMGQGGMSP